MFEQDTARAQAGEGPVGRDAQLTSLCEQGVQALVEEMALGRSERLERYLAFTARFHAYSTFNQLLIYQQRPDATRVAGYRAWQKLGYQVRRGEKGIRILAPRPYACASEETGEEERGVYFVSVAVFDASQLADLDTKPLPEFFTPLEGDCDALYTRLAAVVSEAGIALSESDQTRGAQGYSAHGRIVLKVGLDSRSRFLTLAHEYAHELLHWTAEGRSRSRPVQECHAEAVSFVVARHFGVRNPFSADYLQHYGNTPAALMTELATIGGCAARITAQIEGMSTAAADGVSEPAR